MNSLSNNENDAKPNAFNNFISNNAKIRDNFSAKESLLFWGLFLGPTVTKYWGEKWQDGQPVENHLEKEGIKKRIVNEFTILWNIFPIIQAIYNDTDRGSNIWKLFNNTILRGTLVWLLLPRLFHNTERFHKWFLNGYNESIAKHIFLNKNKRFHKQREIRAIMRENDAELSSILAQLKNKNPNIEDRFNKTMNGVNLDNTISKIEIYKNLIKIKKILAQYNITINREQLKNKINNLNIDSAFKDVDFIIKNRSLIEKISDVKLIRKENSFFNDQPLDKPLEESLLPISSTLYDREIIERDFDLDEKSSWGEYKKHIDQAIIKSYHYPYTTYVNKNKDKKGSWFDEENSVAQLD